MTIIDIASKAIRQKELQEVLSAEKHATGDKGGKTRFAENMQLVASAGKHTKGARCGKICNWCQSARKYVTGAKREKTCNRYQPRENNVTGAQHRERSLPAYDYSKFAHTKWH